MTTERLGDATIYTGDVLEVLRTMSDESVHCIVTSPPYWGLRDYGIEPSVWDGEPGCAHEWGEEKRIRENPRPDHDGPNSFSTTSRGTETSKAAAGFDASTGAFCRLCGAWRGAHGLEPTPELYVQHAVQIFREARRVLRSDGTLWLNIGDSYVGGGRGGLEGCGKGSMEEGRYQSGQRIGQPTGRIDGYKAKDLVGIPWMLAFALRADGWSLRMDVIWHKPNPMPESCTDRPTKSHEYLFQLAKSNEAQFWTHRDGKGTREHPEPDYRWFDRLLGVELDEEPPGDWRHEEIDNPADRKKPEGWMEGEGAHNAEVPEGDYDRPKKIKRYRRFNLWRGHDYFYDAEAVREGVVPGTLTDRVDTGRFSPERGYPGATDHGNGRLGDNPGGLRNRRSVWTIATAPYKGAHFATFPPDLVKPCILAGCPEHVCPKCGASWVREMSERPYPKELANASKAHGGIGNNLGGQRHQDWLDAHPRETIGTHPTCACGLPAIPGTVLDTFGGSGTTAEVALEYGRRAILIERKPEYVELARERLRPVAGRPLLSFGGGIP